MPKRRKLHSAMASITALAGAAIAAAAGSAEAAIIFHPTRGFITPGSLPLPGGNSISLRQGSRSHLTVDTLSLNNERGAFRIRTGRASVYAAGVGFRVAGRTTSGSRAIALTKKGGTFNKVGTGVDSHPIIATKRFFSDTIYAYRRFPSPSGMSVTRPLIGGSGFVQNVLQRNYNTIAGQMFTTLYFSAYNRFSPSETPSYKKEYALFRFDVGPQTDYGWLELSVNWDSNPVVDILGYAYDTTGKPIKAGAIPEPQHLPLALGALALGAIGVREWRKKAKETT